MMTIDAYREIQCHKILHKATYRDSLEDRTLPLSHEIHFLTNSVSVTVNFFGFATNVFALAEAMTEGSRELQNLRPKLKDAPRASKWLSVER
jgi:hypothetical protein